MIVFVLLCTLIGYLCGFPIIGLLVGLAPQVLIWFADGADALDRRRVRRARRRRGLP